VVGGAIMTLVAPTLQAFFTDRLATQRRASPRTVAAYRGCCSASCTAGPA
jgi:hypothetical protein